MGGWFSTRCADDDYMGHGDNASLTPVTRSDSQHSDSGEGTETKEERTEEIEKIEPSSQVRIIVLNNGEHLESRVVRLHKGWVIRFIRGANILGRDVRVKISASGELPWTNDRDDFLARAEFVCRRAGSFLYQFYVDRDKKPAGSGYFVVDPELSLAGRHISLDAIACQTYLSKLLGPLSEWSDRLMVAKESGYNMIHFTPVQTLGSSNSCYSIANPLELNPSFSGPDDRLSLNDVGVLVEKMASEWGILSVQDVVWNHAAVNSPWLSDHPECTYNCKNSPHLRPAYVLDRLYYHFSRQVAAGKWTEKGLPSVVEYDNHLGALHYILTTEILPQIRLAEFFKVDVGKLTKEFSKMVQRGPSSNPSDEKLPTIPGSSWERYGFTVDLKLADKIFNRVRNDATCEEERQKKCIESFRNHLLYLNGLAQNTAGEIASAAINAAVGHVSYQRVNPSGPKIRELTEAHPLLPSYFVQKFPSKSWEEDEKYAFKDDTSAHLIAFNGWVMGDDPLRNFAVYPSQVYLRRELICWNDSVKLRYGDKPADCPYLWDLMKKYSQSCARIFHGIRIENCHSTPVHVAEYLLKAAREVRSDLYVTAELCTGNEDVNNIFVNRLGITSIVREAQNAYDSHEQGRLVCRYGGDVVGAFIQKSVQNSAHCVAPAIFYDQTYDNASAIQKRSVYDVLPTAAMIAMANCATGSVRGYDELFDFLVDVVHEKRLYERWNDVGNNCGIIAARRIINGFHAWLADNGYTQVFVEQMNFDIVAITRHNPQTHDSVLLVAHTAFKKDAICMGRPPVRDLDFKGSLVEILFEAGLLSVAERKKLAAERKRLAAEKKRMEAERMHALDAETQRSITQPRSTSEAEAQRSDVEARSCAHPKTRSSSNAVTKNSSDVKTESFPNTETVGYSDDEAQSSDDEFDPEQKITDENRLIGLGGYSLILKEHIGPKQSQLVTVHGAEDGHIELNNFRSGSVIAFMISPLKCYAESVESIRRLLSGQEEELDRDFQSCLERMTLQSYNRILFRCHEEEVDECGTGVYQIPGYGSLVYCGLQGLVPLLKTIRENNDLGHPLCSNLRDGMWLCEYIVNRLVLCEETRDYGLLIDRMFLPLKDLQHHLRPCYFEAIFSRIISVTRKQLIKKLHPSLASGSNFVRSLALSTVSFLGTVKSAKLSPLSASIAIEDRMPLSLCAGLPLFSVGVLRDWGRHTFIALPGCLLITGRYSDARSLILSYAGALRHGLIPNFLAGGQSPRYNSRDAVWYWLYAIVKYAQLAPNGEDIFGMKVFRLYPTDDAEYGKSTKEELLHETMFEVLNRHFAGIRFRERGAGLSLDEHMNSGGFNVSINVDLETGFIYGGNNWNCGTWMNKMGTSKKAGNFGIPATPRDGAAVELQGLAFAVLQELQLFYNKGTFPHKGVHNGSLQWTWSRWASLLKQNFERHFFVGNDDTSKYVNRRGILKDTCGSSAQYTDYQLRPNFCIALALAPKLMNAKNAWRAIKVAEEVLLGPLGMKTLDPRDWSYGGYYNNDEDSDQRKTAKGWNYHQGPEWVWVAAYFLRAKLAVAKELNDSEIYDSAVRSVRSRMGVYWDYLQRSPWRSLPELTCENGAVCSGCNTAEACSVACVLEVADELYGYH